MILTFRNSLSLILYLIAVSCANAQPDRAASFVEELFWGVQIGATGYDAYTLLNSQVPSDCLVSMNARTSSGYVFGRFRNNPHVRLKNYRQVCDENINFSILFDDGVITERRLIIRHEPDRSNFNRLRSILASISAREVHGYYGMAIDGLGERKEFIRFYLHDNSTRNYAEITWRVDFIYRGNIVVYVYDQEIE